MIWLALALLATWLLVLSLLFGGLVRHVGTLALARAAGPLPLLPHDFDTDGPQPGGAVPPVVEEILAARWPSDGDRDKVLVFLSPGCGTCLEVAEEIVRHPVAVRDCVAFLMGAREDTPSDLRDVLSARSNPIIEGNDARAALRALDINSIPFAVRIGRGTIIAKRFLRQAANLMDLLESKAATFTEPEKVVNR